MNLLREKQRAAGWHPSGSDSPDTSGQNQAALMTAKLSQEQLDWAKQVYAENAPARDAATARANEVSDLQMTAQRKSLSLADELAGYNRATLQPLQKAIARDAMSFDTEGTRERMAGEAGADVAQGFTLARARSARDMARSGVNPASGAALSLNSQMDTQEALGLAGAKNKARTSAVTLADAKMKDAASVLNGLPGNQTTTAGLALNQGNSAAANSVQSLVPEQNAQLSLNTAYGGAKSGYAQSGNIYAGLASGEAATDAANSSNVAKGVGAAVSAYGTYAAAAGMMF